jgi:hypothetical protein
MLYSTFVKVGILDPKGMGVLVHRRRQNSGSFGKITHAHCSD